MQYEIREYDRYQEDEILNLYQSIGWFNYVKNPDMVKNAYENSLKVFGSYQDKKLIGIIRVVGDGYSIIYIQDILILPEYQHMGIGTALLNKILEIYQNTYQKILLTDNTEKTIQFYKSAGFRMDTDIGCRAFIKM